METVKIDLYKADDSGESYAIKLAGQQAARAQAGYGQSFKKVWSVDIETERPMEQRDVDWDAVLQRVVEAYTMSDPVISGFRWPQQQSV